jgi:hypothetical protein
VTTPWSSDRTSATSKRAQYRRSLPSPHHLPPPCMRLSIVPLRRPPAYLGPSPFLARLKPQASRLALFLAFLAFAHLHPFLSHPLKKRDLMIRSETNQTGWPVWERRGPHRRSERSAARQDTTLIADLRPVCWRQPCLLGRQTGSICAVRGLLCDAGRRGSSRKSGRLCETLAPSGGGGALSDDVSSCPPRRRAHIPRRLTTTAPSPRLPVSLS